METRKFKKPYVRRFVSTKEYDHFKTLGAAPLPLFPASLVAPVRFIVQTAENCTAYSGVNERFAETGTIYDPEKQWAEELAFTGSDGSQGITLDQKMQCGIKVGFTIVGGTGPQDKALSYFYVTQASGLDWFDSFRLALFQLYQKYGKVIPITVGVNWYSDWDMTLNGILTMNPKNLLGGHDLEIPGLETWKDNVDYLDGLSTWGQQYGDQGIFRIPRNVFNSYFSGYGAEYWSDDASLEIAKLNRLEVLLENLVTLYKRLLPPVGFPPPVPLSKIQIWANAIAKAEDAKPSLNNCGDLKYSTLTASWGATKGFPATDGGWIAKFATYEQGMSALCNFLRLGAENELIAFHSAEARTLEGFTKIFAGNPASSYYSTIYAETGWAPSTDISTLLT